MENNMLLEASKGTPRGYRVVLACEICKKEMVFLASVLRVRKAIRFCSRKCMGISSKKEDSRQICKCTNCGVEFTKRADHVTGNNFCGKNCSSEYRKVDGATWRDPTKIKVYMSEYQKKNKEKLREKGKNWAKKNAHKKLCIQKRYRDANGPLIAMGNRARRFGMKAGSFTHDEWQLMKLEGDNRCLCCKKQEPDISLEVDHIVPFKYGGEHKASNIQPLCRSCNASKGVKTIDYRHAHRGI
jgi:5-methylcytosine-specific restriction endonuclease McrA